MIAGNHAVRALTVSTAHASTGTQNLTYPLQLLTSSLHKIAAKVTEQTAQGLIDPINSRAGPVAAIGWARDCLSPALSCVLMDRRE
jgi:hypothetical protein